MYTVILVNLLSMVGVNLVIRKLAFPEFVVMKLALHLAVLGEFT